MKLAILSLCVLSQTLALSAQSPSIACVPQTSNFDDLTAGALPLSQNSIGIYNGLNFERFATLATGGISLGVLAQSPRNAAGIGLTRSLTQTVQEILTNPLGLLSGGNTPKITLFPYATISAALPGQSFDLFELYYGCSVNLAVAGVSLATSCIFSASGYNDKGVKVSEETFSFAPTTGGGLVRPRMERKVLEKFKRMRNVTLSLVDGGVGTAATAVLFIDDVKTCIYRA